MIGLRFASRRRPFSPSAAFARLASTSARTRPPALPSTAFARLASTSSIPSATSAEARLAAAAAAAAAKPGVLRVFLGKTRLGRWFVYFSSFKKTRFIFRAGRIAFLCFSIYSLGEAHGVATCARDPEGMNKKHLKQIVEQYVGKRGERRCRGPDELCVFACLRAVLCAAWCGGMCGCGCVVCGAWCVWWWCGV